MKKILTFCILILLVPGLFGFTAYAYAYQSVKAEIEVEVILGGKVAIISNVNCPIPEKTELTLKDGEIGKFEIDFTEVGVFDYTVKTVPDDRDIEFDDTVYNIKFYVTDNDGRLVATVIASKGRKSTTASSLSTPKRAAMNRLPIQRTQVITAVRLSTKTEIPRPVTTPEWNYTSCLQ